jgi:hypothetical protein
LVGQVNLTAFLGEPTKQSKKRETSKFWNCIRVLQFPFSLVGNKEGKEREKLQSFTAYRKRRAHNLMKTDFLFIISREIPVERW